VSLLRAVEKLTRRAFAGFPEHYTTRLGVVVAIPDPPDGEKGTDRFRPRYAVDVQILSAGGGEDTSRPVLEALPLPASQVMRYPEIGEQVRVGFDYGSPAHPYIVGPVNEGRAMPALAPGETWQPLGDGAFLKADAKGDITLQTDGTLTLDAGTISVAADELVENLGSVTRAVEGDVAQEIGGSLRNTVLGALVEQVAGDARRAILGGMETTVAGDRAELVGGALQMLAGQDIEIKTALGNLALEVVAGTVAIGKPGVELLAIVDSILTASSAQSHPPLGGISSNVADFILQQTLMALIKG